MCRETDYPPTLISSTVRADPRVCECVISVMRRDLSVTEPLSNRYRIGLDMGQLGCDTVPDASPWGTGWRVMFDVTCTACGVIASNVSGDEGNRWVRSHWHCPEAKHGDTVSCVPAGASTWKCETCATVIVNGPDTVDTPEKFAAMFALHAANSPACTSSSLISTRG